MKQKTDERNNIIGSYRAWLATFCSRLLVATSVRMLKSILNFFKSQNIIF